MPWVKGGNWRPASVRGQVIMYGSFLALCAIVAIWRFA